MKAFLLKNFGAIVWLVALVLAAVIYFSIRKKKNEKSESETAIDSLTIDPAGLSITENEAVVRSENLLAAMNQYGTDEDAIIKNLEGLTRDDMLLIMKKFGVRPYNGAGLATRGYEKSYFSQDLNLTGWLRSELDGSDLDKVIQLFETNGISV